MQSLHKLIGKGKISGNENLKETTFKYLKEDKGYETFVNYIKLAQNNLGNCDPFSPCYRSSRGGLNA